MGLHSKYVCQQCGYESTGWLGKCPECGTWNSLVETVVETTSGKNKKGKGYTSERTTGTKAQVISLSEIKSSATKRVSTKISELDRVLGGGLVQGQVVLVAGEPGIGKSTLLLHISNNLGDVLYVCGEESVNQIKVRADRLGVKKDRN